VTTNILPARGRPREFDIDTAFDIGQNLFHQHGYEAVGLAALTKTLNIKPPSFYKAFGSKAAFFGRILDRYSASVLALEDILPPERDPGEALADLLERAAKTYAQNPKLRGCLVLEAARGGEDDESAVLARRIAEGRRHQIRSFVALSHPKGAGAVTDYVTTTMSGLSASAREGMSKPRLLAVARAAATAVQFLLTNKN
jgi:TetR/AcrR family transcriptional repressor for divergent bdcA